MKAVLCPPAQKGDSRGAEFLARMGDVLTNDFMRNAEMISDGFVRIAVRQLATDFALAWREATFVSGCGMRRQEGFCQKRGNDAVLIIRLQSRGEKRDETQFFHVNREWQRIDDRFQWMPVFSVLKMCVVSENLSRKILNPCGAWEEVEEFGKLRWVDCAFLDGHGKRSRAFADAGLLSLPKVL